MMIPTTVSAVAPSLATPAPDRSRSWNHSPPAMIRQVPAAKALWPELAALLLSSTLLTWPQTTPMAQDRASLQALTEAVVRIETQIPPGATTGEVLGNFRTGSGVMLDASTILTIDYLLLEADEVELITADGRHVPGAVAGFDQETGFGVVRSALPLEGRPMELGDSDTVSEFHTVLNIGQGETEATPLTVVSRKPFTGSWEFELEAGIFTFPPVSNWSGSALLDLSGRLVGIGSLVVADSATALRGVPGNLFVPINLLKPILNDLLTRGRRAGPARPWLGLTTIEAHGRLVVSRVASGGPAEQAGIRAGDLILGVGTDPVASQSGFYHAIWQRGPAGTIVPLQVLIGGEAIDVAIQSIDRMAFLKKPAGI